MNFICKYKALRYTLLFLMVFSATGYSALTIAESYYWRVSAQGQLFYSPSPINACSQYMVWRDLYSPTYSHSVTNMVRLHPFRFRCIYEARSKISDLVISNNAVHVDLFGDACPSGTEYNVQTGECDAPEPDDCVTITPECLARIEKGSPDFCPSPYAGNPINFAIGNKFQKEIDYQASGNSVLKLSRSYNSVDGLWRHNYSTNLRTTDSTQTIALVTASGKEFFYTSDGSSITSASADLGVLSQTSTGWLFAASDNERFTFNTAGKLTHWTNTQGQSYQLAYSGSQITVTDNLGNSLSLSEDTNHQPLSLSASGVQITYSYNANKRLTSVNRTMGGQTTQRQYHYEISGKPDLLTGITDERGVRYATWAYDDQGRAISSEHADGADKVTVAYNSDGTVSVTNELGRVATYSFQTILGVKRITAIDGEPSPNCPNSNSTFTYDDRGLLKTKTDNKGNVTTYDYNERGLEISRTEASGTPQARTITTQWHQDWFLPTAVTELGRTIQYSYDNHGRQTSLSVIQAIP
ncbi:DUF6531 domain-containing protein [Ectopseudomonas khazarica]|uniref:DUF6531 domain-containing protein n=1 Tax=Ectopseudomonas khazarica TaxID=2502979 RepID=UPI00384FB0B3